jgi:molybdate transport repressor ModE-like protein
MASPPEWSDLRVLLALSRAGSMVAAAEKLGVEHTTVSRRISALEKALDVRLVGRSRTGVTFTDAGREAVRAAEEMERAHEALERRLARGVESPSGSVRVTMTDGFTPMVLRLLPAISAAHPDLEVQVQTTPAVLRIEKGEADIGIRLVKPTAPSLVSRAIAEVGWSLFSSTD